MLLHSPAQRLVFFVYFSCKPRCISHLVYVFNCHGALCACVLYGNYFLCILTCLLWNEFSLNITINLIVYLFSIVRRSFNSWPRRPWRRILLWCWCCRHVHEHHGIRVGWCLFSVGPIGLIAHLDVCSPNVSWLEYLAHHIHLYRSSLATWLHGSQDSALSFSIGIIVVWSGSHFQLRHVLPIEATSLRLAEWACQECSVSKREWGTRT